MKAAEYRKIVASGAKFATEEPKRPKRARKPRMKETALVKACLQYLALAGCFAWRQNQGAMSAEHNGKERFIRFSGAKGISDIIGMTRCGRFLAVECKIAPNGPTDDQAAYLARVRESGGIGVVIYSLDDLESAIAGTKET